MLTSPPVIASIWTPYGLSDDPFFQTPLEPKTDAKARRPATLHVGREQELATIASRILSDSNSRSLVHGPAGIGKTSFISKLKATLQAHQVLMHEEPVRVLAGMAPRHLLAEILKVLLQIQATDAATNNWVDGVAARWRVSAEERVFWKRLRRIIHGEDANAGGATAGFLGGQFEPVRIAGEVGDISLFDEVKQALEYLSQNGARKVVVHVNNLESLGLQDMPMAAMLMLQVRDVFLAPYGHWLFVGTSEIEPGIFRVHSQVSSIIPPGTALGPLTPDEVAELIRRRYKHLQRGMHLIEPIPAEDAGALYARYRGDLRKFLTLAGEGVRRHALSNPGVPISREALIGSMAHYHWNQTLLARATPQDAAHLRQALAGEGFDVEFRAVDLKQRIGTVSQPTASAIIRRLAAAGVIAHSRTSGKSEYYRINDGDCAVALNLT
jgi:hypothetical protein